MQENIKDFIWFSKGEGEVEGLQVWLRGGGVRAHKVALKQSGNEGSGAGTNCRMLGTIVKE
jgi:hypothetical protein